MSAPKALGGGDGPWGPWLIGGSPGGGGNIPAPGQVKVSAGDAAPGFLEDKIVTVPGSGIIIAPVAGPPETLKITAKSPDKMQLIYYWNSSGGPFSNYDSYIYTSSATQYDVASPGEYPTPLDFIADQVFLSAQVTSNTTNPFGAPPAQFQLQATQKGVAIPGCVLSLDNGVLGYHTNESTVVGALGDTFGLQLIGTNLALAPTAQDIEFCAMLYILGHGTT